MFSLLCRQRFVVLAAVAIVTGVAPEHSAAGPATQPVYAPFPANMRRPMPRPAPDDPVTVTDEQVDQAIHRGVDYLCGRFDDEDPPSLTIAGPRRPHRAGDGNSNDTGPYYLAVYALLESGLAIKDPRLDPRRPEMKALIEALKSGKPRDWNQTYAIGIRATALAVYNRPEDRDALMADAYWLVSVCDGGAYTYKYPTPTLPRVRNNDRTAVAGYPPPPAHQAAAQPTLQDEVNKMLGKGGATSGNGEANQGAPATQPDYSDPGSDRPMTPGQIARKIALGKTFSDRPTGEWDNSNSQYGLLGVWSAAEAGVEIPRSYWEAIKRHWTESQTLDGRWPYMEGILGKHSMTCAGLASQIVTHEYLVPPKISDDVGRSPYDSATVKGLVWFEHADNSVTLDRYHIHQGNDGAAMASYSLYAMERVGLISGFKHFGRHDWYKLMARQLVSEQCADGSWRANAVDTSFCLLSLARGRHPILMSKLRFDGNMPVQIEAAEAPDATAPRPADMWVGYWANRPRDAASLARFVGKQLERRFNWEVVNVALDWTDWTDAPVLELASHATPQFTSRDLDMIRQYVLAGGLLFTQADGNSEIFNRYAAKLAHELFPQYEMVDVPAGHPIYTSETVYNIRPRPPLKMVSNGSRVLMLHSPTDITRWWQQRDDVRHKDAFQLGMNLFVYAAGKQNFRNRLQETWVTQPAEQPIATIGLARIGYAGNWDPEPFAWRRYANWFQRRTGTRIETRAVAAADLGSLDPAQCPLAHLTGTAKHDFSRTEIAAIRQYVQSGGVLLIDQCGGMGTFDQSAEALLATAFAGQKLEPLPANYPLLRLGNPGTQDVSKPLVRAEVVTRYGKGAGALRTLAYGKGRVLYSTLDIISGLLGTSTLGILGYEPDYAQALVKNIVFWALDGQKEQ